MKVYLKVTSAPGAAFTGYAVRVTERTGETLRRIMVQETFSLVLTPPTVQDTVKVSGTPMRSSVALRVPVKVIWDPAERVTPDVLKVTP